MISRPRFAHFLLVGVTVGVIFILAALVRTPAFVLVLLSCLCALLALAFFRWPNTIVPTLALTLPLEASKLLFPILLLDKTVGGESVSVLDFTRVALAIAMASIVVRELVGAKGQFQWNRAALMFGGVTLAIGVVSWGFVAPSGSNVVTELVRLALNIMLLNMAAALTRSAAHIRMIFVAIALIMVVIAGFAVIQDLTGVFLWNAGLTESGFNRANVTFADPNILARYLSILFLIALLPGLLPIKRVYRFVICALSAVAVLSTYSRSGMLLLGVAGVLVLTAARGKARLRVGAGIIAGIAAISSLIAVRADLLRRFVTFGLGADVAGSRIGLIHTGFVMFMEHFFFGVGLGSFQYVALRDYADLLPYGGSYVTLSHTSLVTIAAELGLFGLGLVGTLFGLLYMTARSSRRDPSLRPLADGCFFSSVLILGSSLSEGRLFEEPLLWIFFGAQLSIASLLIRLPRESTATYRLSEILRGRKSI